jgi:hypothetical protein
VIRGLENFALRIWNMGFEAVRELAQYVFAGAVIVVPVWLVMRLLSARGR